MKYIAGPYLHILKIEMYQTSVERSDAVITVPQGKIKDNL